MQLESLCITRNMTIRSQLLLLLLEQSSLYWILVRIDCLALLAGELDNQGPALLCFLLPTTRTTLAIRIGFFTLPSIQSLIIGFHTRSLVSFRGATLN